jgi:hypothetical protein
MKLGSPSLNAINDSGDFRSIRQFVKSLPPAPKAAENRTQTSSTGQASRPPRPSDQLQNYDGENISLRFPDNWKANESDLSLTLAPEGGIIGSGNTSAIAYGATISIFTPGTANSSSVGLAEATDQLIADLRNSNSGMRVTKNKGKIRVGGKPALSKILTNDAPAGGRETDWLVTVLRPEGLLYFIFVAPEQEFADYQKAFQQILNSVSYSSQ